MLKPGLGGSTPGSEPTSRTLIPGERPPNRELPEHTTPSALDCGPPTAGCGVESHRDRLAGDRFFLPRLRVTNKCKKTVYKTPKCGWTGAYEFPLKAFCEGTPPPGPTSFPQQTLHGRPASLLPLPGPRAPHQHRPDQMPKGPPPSWPGWCGPACPSAAPPCWALPLHGQARTATSSPPPAQRLTSAQGPPLFQPHTRPQTTMAHTPAPLTLGPPGFSRCHRRPAPDAGTSPGRASRPLLPAALLTHCPHCRCSAATGCPPPGQLTERLPRHERASGPRTSVVPGEPRLHHRQPVPAHHQERVPAGPCGNGPGCSHTMRKLL